MTETSRLLIVDDEPGVRFVLERALARDGYLIDTAENGEEAILKIQQTPYDLILLDLQMEPVNGIAVLKKLREIHSLAAVIILTAHGSLDSAVEALRLTAFDYLFKPTSNEILRDRVREGLAHRQAMLRRARLANQIESLRQTLEEMEQEEQSLAPPDESGRFVRAGMLVIDLHHQVATYQNRLLDLTTTEFNILTSLAKAAPRPVSARQLVNLSLGYDVEDAEAAELMKFHIHHLRKKIEDNPQKPACIKTVRYKGYLWSGS